MNSLHMYLIISAAHTNSILRAAYLLPFRHPPCVLTMSIPMSNRIINQNRRKQSDKSADYRPRAHQNILRNNASARSALISQPRELFFSFSVGGASGGGGAHKSICNFFQQRQQQALCLHTRTPPAHTRRFSWHGEPRG